MTQPIKDPTDPRRRQPAETLERAQAILWATGKLFDPDTLAAKALRLAYEAARVAYYGIIDETDGDHLPDVRQALRVVEEHLEATRQ
jgi:hypothetical protein